MKTRIILLLVFLIASTPIFAHSFYTHRVEQYNSPRDAADVAEAMAVDGSGGVYITGYSYGDITGRDIATIRSAQCDCRPGDANGDGNINIADASYIINWIWMDGPPPTPYATCSGDANGDCSCNIADFSYLYNYIWFGGPPPVSCPAWVNSCGTPIYK